MSTSLGTPFIIAYWAILGPVRQQRRTCPAWHFLTRQVGIHDKIFKWTCTVYHGTKINLRGVSIRIFTPHSITRGSQRTVISPFNSDFFPGVEFTEAFAVTSSFCSDFHWTIRVLKCSKWNLSLSRPHYKLPVELHLHLVDLIPVL